MANTLKEINKEFLKYGQEMLEKRPNTKQSTFKHEVFVDD